jgi:transposase-like protein
MNKIKFKTLAEINQELGSDLACNIMLRDIRCPDKKCPRCKHDLERYSRKLHRSDEFLCTYCKKHIHVRAGTFLHHHQMDLKDALPLLFLHCGSKNGLATLEIERLFGHSYKTTESLIRRMRMQMGRVLDEMIYRNTIVEADEKFMSFGNFGKDRHEADNRGKFNVFGMLSREGVAKLIYIKGRKQSDLIPLIERYADQKTVIINTDEFATYQCLSEMGWHHETVNHSKGEFVKPDGTTTNGVEGLFSRLGKSVIGTYGSVGPENLQFILNEFAFKYTFRNEEDYGFKKLFQSMPTLEEHYNKLK